MPGPLEGIRVVEMGFWVAGPGAAGIMADWGAEVIKVEEPEGGDPFRAFLSTGVREVLLATGYSWEEMAKLREQGVIL